MIGYHIGTMVKITLRDVHINEITKDKATLVTDDYDEINIFIDDLEDWD